MHIGGNVSKLHGHKMHSSRMRTAHLLTVSRSTQLGGCLLVPGGPPPLHIPRPVHAGIHPRGQTDTCENITFPNFVLRTVIIISHFSFNSRHHEKCKFALKLIALATTSNLFSLEFVQKMSILYFTGKLANLCDNGWIVSL